MMRGSLAVLLLALVACGGRPDPAASLTPGQQTVVAQLLRDRFVRLDSIEQNVGGVTLWTRQGSRRVVYELEAVDGNDRWILLVPERGLPLGLATGPQAVGSR